MPLTSRWVPWSTASNIDASILPGTSAATTLNSYVQVPVVLGGEGMMYNLPSLNAKFKKYPVVLSSAVLAGIYDGAITKWNDSGDLQAQPEDRERSG